jgi:hypothetical protein
MEVNAELEEELVQIVNKRFVDDELIETYNALPVDFKTEIVELYNKKFDQDTRSRFQRLFTSNLKKRYSPTPRENEYLKTIINYYTDYMNGIEKMSFEEIENL